MYWLQISLFTYFLKVLDQHSYKFYEEYKMNVFPLLYDLDFQFFHRKPEILVAM